MNLFESIITVMAEHEARDKKLPKIVRQKIGECIVCKQPRYNTNVADEKPRMTIIKGSLHGGKGFNVVNVGAKSHNCIVNKPTKFTAELFIKETMELVTSQNYPSVEDEKK